MKKLLSLALALLFILTSCAVAYAEQEQAEPDWYELDENEEVLTIRLPANLTTGYEWTFEISDPEALELVTQEYIEDENGQQLVGVGGTWAASFHGTFAKAGDVDLTLTYKRSFEEEAAETRLVKLWIVENNQLQVVSAEVVDPS